MALQRQCFVQKQYQKQTDNIEHLMTIMDHLHWQHLLAKLLATVTSDSHMTVLALATMGGMTQIESFLFLSFGQGK